jgi:hypothetical protein
VGFVDFDVKGQYKFFTQDITIFFSWLGSSSDPRPPHSSGFEIIICRTPLDK